MKHASRENVPEWELPRFYCPGIEEGMEKIADLSGEEAHHALHVLRVRSGDRVVVFNGRGGWSVCDVLDADRGVLRARVEAWHQDAPPTTHLTLAQAWLNHEKNVEPIIRSCTALGVARIVFFRGDHSERTPRQRDKWSRYAIETCKQCGRNDLPELAISKNLAECMGGDSQTLLVATQHRSALPIAESLGDAKKALLVIGPEGDFSEGELAVLDSLGATPVSLGERTLRSELAATVGVALAQHVLGRFGPV